MEEDKLRKHERHFQRFLWVHYAVVFLGVWLLVSPVTFGYPDGSAFVWSDHASGVLLILFGCLSLSPRRLWAPWAAFVVGAWLNLAPLVLPDPLAANYINATLVGIAVVALTILIPDVPGSVLSRKPGPDIPPGWSYNPSSWIQRKPLIILAIGGWFLSRYLAAFQLGFIDAVWDPFFGEGTARVLKSSVSEAFPVSDAGLGAFAYTFEALLAFMGLKDRWRTNPSTVLVFGVLVIPVGVTHLVLVTLMPIIVGYWCTLCLLTAGLMLLMVPLAIDEVVASIQFLARKRREGYRLVELIVTGEGLSGNERNPGTPPPNAPWQAAVPAMWRGMGWPWTLLLSAGLGIWLIASPVVLGFEGALANSSILAGALVVTVSVVAWAEVARAFRLVNLALAVWVIVSPWIFSGSARGVIAGAIAGLVLSALTIPRGKIHNRYGEWERYIR